MLRLIGSATTDTNGVASLNYTGKGVGLLDIVAKCENVESNQIEIADCLYYDRGSQADHNTNHSNYNSYFTVSYTDDYTDLKENSANHGRYSVTSGGNYLPIPFGYRIECDVKCVDGASSNTPFRIINPNATSNITSSITISALNMTVNTWCHCILDITSDGIIVTREDGTTTTKSLPNGVTSAVAMAFWGNDSITEIQFKNLKIYPV